MVLDLFGQTVDVNSRFLQVLVVLKRTDSGLDSGPIPDFTTRESGMMGGLNDAVCHWDFMHGQASLIF